MKKLLHIVAIVTTTVFMFGFISCSNTSGNESNHSAPSGGSGGAGNNGTVTTSISSERLILESKDNGIQVTIIGESGWGGNTWVEDQSSNIDIFARTFDNQNKCVFLYPFTKNGETYKFRLSNQSNGTEPYSSAVYEIKALGGVGYPMSDAFKNMTVEPSHNDSGEFLVNFNTTATKLGDFFRVDINLLTENHEAQPILTTQILFGYPGVCSQASYSNVTMCFASADVNCVNGSYSLNSNNNALCTNLFDLMKIYTFETYAFSNTLNIADFQNLYYARPGIQIGGNGSTINYWIRGKNSEKKTY